MLKTYADLKKMMEELEEKNLDPDTKILFGDSDTNSYNVFKARVPFAKDILDYEFDEDEDKDKDREEFSKEKCIFFEVE